jgi:hypothetical protein
MMFDISIPCFQNPCDEIPIDFHPTIQTDISLAGCEGREVRRLDVPACPKLSSEFSERVFRASFSSEFFERVFRAETTHGSTCYVRKHACEGRCLIERMVKAIKAVVLSCFRWTNGAAGSAPGSRKFQKRLRNTFDKMRETFPEKSEI